jgi:hypothetical protein
MNVKELIEFLQKQQQDLPVAFRRYSEQCLMEENNISVEVLGAARPDGWVPDRRDNIPTQTYLLFPGN